MQRDYVKWRGVLFLRFLPSLVDESEKIRHLSDFLFGSILKGFYTLGILYHFCKSLPNMNLNVVAAKAPLLAYNSFIEAIYVLNNYTGHGGFSESQGSQSSQGSDRGSTLFAIR